MKGRRRRILSTFQITKFGPGSSWPSSLVLPPLEPAPQMTSAVRRRRVLDLGLSPRLSRQASDLKLQHNKDRECETPAKNVSQHKTFALHSQTGTHGYDPQRLGLPLEAGVGNSKLLIQTPPLYPQHISFSRFIDPQTSQKLRRPTVFPARPVLENGPLFHLLVKGKELKPLGKADDEEASSVFYATHFPLLLRKLSNASDPFPVKKVMTEFEMEEQLRLNELRCRAREVHERLARAEDMLRQFEIDPEDKGPIKTELRNDLFNPAAWPWNIERYSLDRLLRE